MGRAAVVMLLLLALAPPAWAGAEQSIGDAIVGATKTMPRTAEHRGHLSPARAAALLARVMRAAGDEPRRVTCSMRSRDAASCRLMARRGGSPWRGTGEVSQGARSFRVGYQLSAGNP